MKSIRMVAILGVLVPLHPFAKVPLQTFEATCTTAKEVFVGEVASTELVKGSMTAQWIATFRSREVFKGDRSSSELHVYYQPGSSVSAKFTPKKSYVVFAVPYKQALAPVNGQGGVLTIENDDVDDSVLLDSQGSIKLSELKRRLHECTSIRHTQ